MTSSFRKFEVASESAAANAPANSWAALLYHTNLAYEGHQTNH